MKYVNGVKNTIIDRLNALEGTSIERDKIIDQSFIEVLCHVTGELGREVAMFLDRRGEVLAFAIGDDNTVSAMAFHYRRSEESLSGVRCIHTHPNGSARLSEVDMAALQQQKYDMMVAIGTKNGAAEEISAGWIGVENGETVVKITRPFRPMEFTKLSFQKLIQEIEAEYKTSMLTTHASAQEKEQAILVGIESEEALDELEELLETSGGEAVGRMVQLRDTADKGYLIGTGKLKDLMLMTQARKANLVVFDEELSGIQVKNLEDVLGMKVIDRTQLILDIFAQRARSKEGKLQVELAQLKYSMPRLIGLGVSMSRTGGGIGTRGPGEKKLEIDRRRIRDRVTDLEREIQELDKRRTTVRRGRSERIFHVCIVGYTNAGKSTLLNGLADANIYAMDQLFATLDPTTRKVDLPSGNSALITDTVGFIRKLPHDLVAAFQSTLEEVVYADLLLHVVDVSNEDWEEQYVTVNHVLHELGASGKDTIVVMNKMDKVSEVQLLQISGLVSEQTVAISAKYQQNLGELLHMVEHFATKGDMEVKLKIPYADGAVLSFLHDNAKILDESYEADGTLLQCIVRPMDLSRVEKYMIS